MSKRSSSSSSFLKVLAVVALLLVLPTMLASYQSATCQPPDCGSNCSGGHYDCTYWWVMSSWENFQTAAVLMAMGYTVLVCCSE